MDTYIPYPCKSLIEKVSIEHRLKDTVTCNSSGLLGHFCTTQSSLASNWCSLRCNGDTWYCTTDAVLVMTIKPTTSLVHVGAVPSWLFGILSILFYTTTQSSLASERGVCYHATTGETFATNNMMPRTFKPTIFPGATGPVLCWVLSQPTIPANRKIEIDAM